jgi:prolipoprotein diacylglyceryltransferase
MTEREQLEYSALRATIRERGTARFYVFAGGFAAWGALVMATAALAFSPLATLLPLLVLAAIFEAVFALHIGVERIGRYLHVFHEETGVTKWEHAAMAFGRPKGAATTDALFSIPFFLAAVFNVAPALIVEPTTVELIFIGGAHALFVLRLLVARETARRQRAIDQARFEQLKAGQC